MARICLFKVKFSYIYRKGTKKEVKRFIYAEGIVGKEGDTETHIARAIKYLQIAPSKVKEYTYVGSEIQKVLEPTG